ncbi:TIGR02530 family flagellar biosynthesis protein [Bacillus suaedaesalsae]|uniref:Flagellar protein n=1 Tax=Bacillus suaedaesalsae TaxID=2810349 RepID=A0ABS2DIX0_9BACI|nr:TIGR02530 family flagellar biosynthesis protein [Bacillus suaedaesalsae]MBM6618440.1 flagellar protein [Bacillus suaedaesalsae]
MDHRIRQLQHHPLSLTNKNIGQSKEVTTSFRDVLQDVVGIKISKHAQKRLSDRKIEIADEKWVELQEKMLEAKNKGIIDSLVVMEKAALIVNTKNNTVVTAMGREEASSQIFTNINGTIILDQ